ncbi:DNA ligase [Cellulophaga phage phi4:1]|uniref:DNA ligase n=3 Tax=Lightbulbvirus Cba41 TaxID=1918524 RepID=A0A0S2MWD4_9CAUD|nr:ATP-dependent DNA ligase [Cellulophaga phage phi4:1]AGO49442.1 DNA ligase [Cellulophaga phage phi4:1]ALO80038.1 DNA ligase [Cellulophaga phage phi4:1_13]ALO80235.1 DNA ligase [Cellulophaga phage phi4:1_18]
MTIKSILDEIANEAGDKAKMAILSKYKGNPLLLTVIYKALSKRVKFYIKQIPEYSKLETEFAMPLSAAILQLEMLSSREVTGNDAVNFLAALLNSVNPDDAYVLEKIIQKDLKIGIATTYINKVIPNLLEKTPYMGAKPYSEELIAKLFEAGEVVSDIKMDGRYCNAIIRGGEVELESRQGEKTFIGEAYFLKQLTTLPDCVLNGELTILDMNRYEANGVITSIIDIEKNREKRTEEETHNKLCNFSNKHGDYLSVLNRIVYTVWDTITVDEYFDKKSNEGYASRKLSLYTCLDILTGIYESNSRVELVESRKVKNKEEAINHFVDALNRGLEGTMLKAANGKWKDGKPNWQVKMKLDINLDLKIIGFNYGKKGTKNENVISTLQTESSCGLIKTNPSGMDEDMMKFVTANQESLLGTIVEIRCCGLSMDKNDNWSTLHPSVVKLRDDKSTCDSLKTAIEIENAAKTVTK